MRIAMRNKKVVTLIAMVVLATVLLTSGVIASPPTGAGDPPVESKINYQGQLTDSAGNPLDGTYDMEFRFYDSATDGSQVGGIITKNDVTVTDGLFSVKLDVNLISFNGQGLWLEVKVEGETLSPRQEILPVPYALSLKPGAEINGEEDFGAALSVFNRGEGNTYGIYSEAWNTGDWENCGGCFVADGSHGKGVWGYASSTGDATNYGGYFYASGVQGRGVFGKAGGDSGIGVEGFAAAHGDVENYGGKFLAEGTYGTGVHAEATGTDGTGVYAKGGPNGYAADFDGNVIVKGNLEYDGALTGAFPSPAYDSGWVSISQGETKVLTHNLGGNTDNYVVDLQFKETEISPIESPGVHQIYYGEAQRSNGDWIGGSWRRLTDTSIEVSREWRDDFISQIRVRIWVYE